MAETLGKIIEGAANAVTAILRLIPAYKQAQDEAQGLVKSQDELEEKEREYVVESAKNNKEIAELRTKAADRDKYTAKEREAFLNKAISLEEKNMKMERDNAKQSYEIEKQRQSQLRKRTDEDKDKLAELEAAMYKAEENYYSGIIRMQKQAQSAREEDARAEEQALKEREQKYKEYLERRKQQQALELQYRRSYQDIVLEVVKEGEEKEKAQTRLNYQRKKEDLQKALNEEKNLTKAAREEINKAIMLLEAQMQIELNKIIKKYADQRVQDAAAEEAEMVAEIAAGQAAVDKNIRDEFKKQSENYILTLKQQLAQAGNNLQMVADAELEFAKKKYDQLVSMDAEAYEAMGMNATTYKIAVLEAAEDVNKALMNQKRVATEVADGYLSAASTISSAMTDLFNTIGEDNEKMTDFLRGLAMINIAIQTSEALSKAIAAGAGKEWPENLAAIASGIAAVLGGMAQAAAVLKKATQTPSAPKFADGGLVGNTTTERTDDTVTAKLSEGEYVMRSKSVKALGVPLLDALNYGGGVPVGMDNRLGNNGELREMLSDIVAEIHPEVDVKEIITVTNRVKVKENIARR
jgi:hypothetical protein